MATLSSHVFPLVAAPHDNAWVVFRDFEKNGLVVVEALTSNAVVEVASGPTYDPTVLGAATVLTFTQAGTVQKVALPATGTTINRATRILPISGQVKVTVTGYSPFLSFMMAPPVTTFGPL